MEEQGRDIWIKAALAALAEEGIEAVRVERIARRIGKTKGSFYWHFKDLNDLLGALIIAWEAGQGIILAEADEMQDATAADRLRHMFRLVSRLDLGLEAAVRRWGATYPVVLDAVVRVDAARLAHLSGIIAASGVPQAQAVDRARLVYFALIGEMLMGRSVNDLDRPTASDGNIALLLSLP